jgi:4-coumarate--CoA ligase
VDQGSAGYARLLDERNGDERDNYARWLVEDGRCHGGEDSLLSIVDRKKELIKVNAFQTAPAELEALVLKNKHVADAAVVRVVLHGKEWPRAYVVLQSFAVGELDEKDIRK